MNKCYKIAAVPERLRLAPFLGTDEDEQELFRLEQKHMQSFKVIFDKIASGAASVAFWDDAPRKIAGTKNFCVCRRVLSPSARGAGVQLTTFHIINHEYIPIMHQTFVGWESSRFNREHGNVFQKYIVNVTF